MNSFTKLAAKAKEAALEAASDPDTKVGSLVAKSKAVADKHAVNQVSAHVQKKTGLGGQVSDSVARGLVTTAKKNPNTALSIGKAILETQTAPRK